MTRKFKFIILFSAIAIGLSSCSSNTPFLGTSTRKTLQNTPLNADFRFQMQWSDLQYVGEVKATASWTSILGGIKYSNLPNNPTYIFDGGKSFLGGGLIGSTKTDQLVKRALFDAIEKDPVLQEADFIIPVQTKTETISMFLGSKKTQTVKAKLYKLKENK